MKLKRFLTIIALLIFTMIMLTGCEEKNINPKVLMKFDSQTITLKSDQKGYAYLEINVKDGDYEVTFEERFKVSKNKTLTIRVEDIETDFFSKNAQICNVAVVKATSIVYESAIIWFYFIPTIILIAFMVVIIVQKDKNRKNNT